MNGCDNASGLADVDMRELHTAVDDLARTMTLHFEDEEHRRDAALPFINCILSAHKSVEIPTLSAASIGSVKSDGHNITVFGGGSLAVEFKNEQAGIGSIPQVEVVGYIACLIAMSKNKRDLYLRWRTPCLCMTIIGSDITFYGIVAVDRRFRLVNLTSSISFILSATEGRSRTALYLTFTAVLVLQAHILQYAMSILSVHLPDPIDLCPRLLPEVFELLKYPRPFGPHNYGQPPSSDDYFPFEIRDIFPDRQPYRLLYIPDTPDKQRILIKFAKRYSIELHNICAELGYTPAIFAFQKLLGGWYAVAMEYIEDGLPFTHPSFSAANRSHWSVQLQNLMKNFHDLDFVHGDLRDANIICKKDSVMLIDFDWGGKEEEVSYPTPNLNEELLPNRADLRITKENDRRVLEITLAKLIDKVAGTVSTGMSPVLYVIPETET